MCLSTNIKANDFDFFSLTQPGFDHGEERVNGWYRVEVPRWDYFKTRDSDVETNASHPYKGLLCRCGCVHFINKSWVQFA